MTKTKIFYRDGYKYQLAETYRVDTGIHPPQVAQIANFIVLETNGQLVVSAGYAWDGPSGPTWDTKNFMRGSLVHDALYQLIRNGELDVTYRKKVDTLLRDLCIEDGMSKMRAWWVFKGVDVFGHSAATEVKEVHSAP